MSAIGARVVSSAPTYNAGEDQPVTQTTGGRTRVEATMAAGSAVVGAFSIDQTTPGTTNRVATYGDSYSAAVAFTPAAASHTAGDVNGGAGEFTSMGPSGGRVMITTVSLMIADATAAATAWRLYLFNVTPPSALADLGDFTLASGDRASFLGQIDIGTAIDLVDTQYIEVNGYNKQVKLAGTSIFAYLVNLTTLTPAAVAHTVTLHSIAL